MYRTNFVSQAAAATPEPGCSSIRRSGLANGPNLFMLLKVPILARGSSDRVESKSGRPLLLLSSRCPPHSKKQGHLCFHVAFSVSLDRTSAFFQMDCFGMPSATALGIQRLRRMKNTLSIQGHSRGKAIKIQ